MEYQDKFHMTVEQNRRFAKANLARLVFSNARFEGITATLPQIETIIAGFGVDGMAIDDINTIVQLKRGWQYLINEKDPLSIGVEKKINQVVAFYDALQPGVLRSGRSIVSTDQGEYLPPEDIDEAEQANYLANLLASDQSVTDKAMTLMFHNMREQIFWDGNKRSATLAANKLMIENGAGLISVSVDQFPTFLKLISEYYHSNDMSLLKDWTYQHAIYGINL